MTSDGKVCKFLVCGETFELKKDVAHKWGLVAEMYENSQTGEIHEVLDLSEISNKQAFKRLIQWTVRYKDRVYALTDEDRYSREKRLPIYQPEDRKWLPKGSL